MDDALRQGDDLVTDYDSMIAKLIVAGSDREEAIARSKRALAEFEVEGIVTIIPFHRLMLDDERFVEGKHTTKYLDEHIDRSRIDDAQETWGTATVESDDEDTTTREFTVEVDDQRFEVELEEHGAPAIQVDEAATETSGERPGRAGAGGTDDEPEVSGDGETVTAEMQGTILDINVAEGDDVSQGDILCVLEAMKMENDIVAEYGGTVQDVRISEDESVDMGDVMFVIE
jgi:acetyl-CoA/propionyl-CoA carboxylase biotin carboxyl carrier protein